MCIYIWICYCFWRANRSACAQSRSLRPSKQLNSQFQAITSGYHVHSAEKLERENSHTNQRTDRSTNKRRKKASFSCVLETLAVLVLLQRAVFNQPKHHGIEFKHNLAAAVAKAAPTTMYERPHHSAHTHTEFTRSLGHT